MSETRMLVVAVAAAVLCACGTTEHPSVSPSLRRIILFNDDGGKTVGLMKDTEALTVFFNAIKSPTDANKAQLKAAELEGKMFQVDSGTRAEVLKEVPISGVPGMSMMRIRISSGPRQTEEALCFSTQTQPDNSR